MIAVREEQPADRDAVRRVEEAAFGRPDEADIVDALRADPAWALSLVAEVDGSIVGHLLFSRGNRAMTLGHVDYYSRFGFRPAAPEGITNQWGIDDPAWMVRGQLEPGEVRYPAAFGP
jgi:predicted N-acetyltransferase YhbS